MSAGLRQLAEAAKRARSETVTLPLVGTLALLDERDDLDESLTQAAQSMSDLGTELNEALDERDALAARVAAAEALCETWQVAYPDLRMVPEVREALGAAGDGDRA